MSTVTAELTAEYRNDLREQIAEILPKSQHHKIDRILDVIDPEQYLISTVEVLRSAVGIETVEAYGLTIKLDANGDAAEITFPYGAEAIA